MSTNLLPCRLSIRFMPALFYLYARSGRLPLLTEHLSALFFIGTLCFFHCSFVQLGQFSFSLSTFYLSLFVVSVNTRVSQASDLHHVGEDTSSNLIGWARRRYQQMNGGCMWKEAPVHSFPSECFKPRIHGSGMEFFFGIGCMRLQQLWIIPTSNAYHKHDAPLYISLILFNPT